MNEIYLLLGGNIGNRQRILHLAAKEIEKSVGKILKKSKLYETQPWGNENQDNFLNQVIFAQTWHTPKKLLDEILKIEKLLGRVRGKRKWSKRIIDIDILFYLKNQKGVKDALLKGENIILKTDDLEIPHPRIHLRNFTLVPLNEIAPWVFHPVLKKTVSELFAACTDDLKVESVLEKKFN